MNALRSDSVFMTCCRASFSDTLYIIQSYIASMFAVQTIPYSQFLNLLKTGKIMEVAITANQIQGKMKVGGGAVLQLNISS
jgi:hypothetical protein